MSQLTFETNEWNRKHDPKVETRNATLNCIDEVVEFITLLRDRPTDKKFKAVGMHWSLSDAVYSDGEYIETHFPLDRDNPDIPRNSGFALDMDEIISKQMKDYLIQNPPARPQNWQTDPCLQRNFFLPVHLKSGTRICEAYSLLDRTPDKNTNLANTLNEELKNDKHAKAYDGPWAFETLGGSGGQTVFGALTTGTHGGDYLQQPLSDCVMAVHLITDGGSHFWIEPTPTSTEHKLQLTDDSKLLEHYNKVVPDVPFQIIRDDDIFHAVTVGVGRFGVVASMVLRVVPQYCLHEHRRLDTWKQVKSLLLSGRSVQSVFRNPHFAPESGDDREKFYVEFPDPLENRFLQIGLCLAPNGEDDHQCGITQRWFHPMVGDKAMLDDVPRGRKERGALDTAGKSNGYRPPEDLNNDEIPPPSMLEKICANGNFMAGVLDKVALELENVVLTGTVPALGILTAGLGIGAGVIASTICAVLVAAIIALKMIADKIRSSDTTMGEVFNDLLEFIMNNPLIPDEHAIMLIRCIFNEVFKGEQSDRDYVALGYAVMDGHNYLDRSCNPNVESIEVFFDASNPSLYCSYVDAILSFEKAQQEHKEHKFTVGYISLRYIKQSSALIAPARYADTVVLEIAAFRAVSGSIDFVMNAANLARDPNFNASFHWGQYNPLKREEVERHYGERLYRWRKALNFLNGGHNGFSSKFTRHTGLEPI